MAAHGQPAAQRGTFESTWQEIADCIMGRHDFLVHDITGGRKRNREIYDTTAKLSVSLLAGGLHSMLINPASEWFHLKPEDGRLMDIPDVALWFEQAEAEMYNAFNAPEARFSSQGHETLIELVAYGTAGYFVSDKPAAHVLFSSRPLAELFVTENASGVIDTVFRKFEFSALQAVEAWGDASPEKAKSALNSGKELDKMDLLNLIRPTDSPVPMPFSKSGLPFESLFVSMDEKIILERKGFHEMPYMIPRWEKDAGECYGRGPAWTALADAKMLNEMNKTVLQAAQIAVRPPYLVEHDGVITQVNMSPGGQNVVNAGGGFMNPPIQPIESRNNFTIGVDLIRDKRKQVQDAFHWDLLQLITNRGATPMTATQVLELSKNIQRLLSPILGRIQSEFLEPLIERVFGILMRRNAFPPPPLELSGANIKVEYVSPVARAQRDQDSLAIIDIFTTAANTAQVDPGITAVVDFDEGLRVIAANKGVPVKVIRTAAVVEEIRQGERELAAQQAEAEAEAQGASTAATAAGAVKTVVDAEQAAQ